MTNKKLIILILFILLGSESFGQNCKLPETLDSLISTSIRLKYDHYDSLLLVKFVTFKVTESGKVDSIRINGGKYREIDYDKYIHTALEPLKSHYKLVQKSYVLDKELFAIFEGLEDVCFGENDNIFVVPIIINFLSQSESYYSTWEEAIRSFFTFGKHNYFFLETIKVIHTDPMKLK